jgi:anti-sigma factor RsiW
MANVSPLSDQDRENLVAYLDGELHGAEAAALEAKLNLNPGARAEAETLRRTWQLLDYLPRPEPSLTFTQATLTRISALRPVSAARSIPTGRRWLFGIGWAAAILVAGITGFAASKRMPAGADRSEPSSVSVEEELKRDFDVIENLALYKNVDGLPFLESLADADDPDLFGDDTIGM